MLILTIRTDKPEAEIGLFDGSEKLGYETWQAHRQLAESIHQKIDYLLKSHRHELKDLQAIAVFKGPGSFTGLRIGIALANALADSLKIPVLGAMSDDWIKQAVSALENAKNDNLVRPEYGASPHTTKPKH